MKRVVNKFLLASDKFMHQIHLRQPGFTYSPCGTLTKIKERIENLRNRRLTTYLSKRTRESLFSTWHDMEIFKI